MNLPAVRDSVEIAASSPQVAAAIVLHMGIRDLPSAPEYLYEVVDGERPGHRVLRVYLKYIGERRTRRPVLTGLERVSRPGRRVYAGKKDIPWVLSGMGIAIISTPKGMMTGQKARKMGVGGEVVCKVW